MNMFKNKKINFFDLIIFCSFFLLFWLAALSAFGYFRPVFVWPPIIIIIAILLFFRTQIIWPKKFLLILLLVIVISSGFAFLRGWYSGDAYDRWLPVGRQITETGSYPTEFFQEKYGNVSPTLPLLIALTFLITKTFTSGFCIWIPFLFTALTISLILGWLKEKNIGSEFLFFVPMLFLSTAMVQSVGAWNLMTESLLLFFSTAFFYYYEKYSKEPKNLYLILMLFSVSLAFLTKIFIGIAVLLLLLLFIKSKNKAKFFGLSALCLAPAIAWFFRNYLLLSDPFFPILTDKIFISSYTPIINAMVSFLNQPPLYEKLLPRFSYVAFGIFNAFPLIFLAVYGWLKDKKYDFLSLFIIYFLSKEIFFFSFDSSVRYYYLFFGLILVYAIAGLSRLRSKALTGLFIWLAFFSLMLVPFWNSSSDFISGLENKFSFLRAASSWLPSHLFLVMLLIIPFIFLAVRRKDIKIFLIFLYCLNILHLEFIYNKSWLVGWPFIFLALLLLIIYSLKKTFINIKTASIVLISLALILNPWLLGGIYYYRHGLSFPPNYTHEVGKWSIQVLADKVPKENIKDTMLIVDDLPDFYHWFSPYPVVILHFFDFWNLVDLRYDDNMSPKDLYELLSEKGVDFIIQTSQEHPEYAPFFEKVSGHDGFILIDNLKDKYFIWQVI